MEMKFIADRYVCPICGDNIILGIYGADRKHVRCMKDDHDVKRSIRSGRTILRRCHPSTRSSA